MSKDPAFLYGESIFTSTRAKRGKALFLNDHIDRLVVGVEDYYLGRSLAVDEKNSIRNTIKEELSKLPEQEVRLRISIYAKSRSELLPEKFEFKDLKFDFQQSTLVDNENSISLKSFPSPFSSHYPNYKMGSYMPLLRLRLQAKRSGADDAVLLNEQSSFLEASTSNLIFVRGERLFTPEKTLLKGIGLREIERIVPVEKMDIPLGMASGFDGALLTNSVGIAREVNKIDNVEYDNLNRDFVHDMVKEVLKRGYSEE